MMIATPLSFLLFAVSGTVVNQTTGQPQAGATVTLYKISSAGPEAMTSLKSGTDGKFEMPDTPQGGPHMLQTAFAGTLITRCCRPEGPPPVYRWMCSTARLSLGPLAWPRT